MRKTDISILKNKSTKRRDLLQSLQDKYDEVSKIMFIITDAPGTSKQPKLQHMRTIEDRLDKILVK